MSADESRRSLSDRFADVLDSLGLENLTDDYRDVKHEADQRLETVFEDAPELATTPTLAEVDKVNVHRDGDPVLVPVVPVVFEAAGEPQMDRVWGITGDIFKAIHPVFREAHVRHVDVQFAYTDSAESEAIFRRITASQTLLDSFVTDATVDIDDLRERIAAGDDGDDGVPPVHWQEFDARSPAGSGAYAGPAPIYESASRASSSAVGKQLAEEDMVYFGAGAAGI